MANIMDAIKILITGDGSGFRDDVDKNRQKVDELEQKLNAPINADGLKPAVENFNVMGDKIDAAKQKVLDLTGELAKPMDDESTKQFTQDLQEAITEVAQLISQYDLWKATVAAALDDEGVKQLQKDLQDTDKQIAETKKQLESLKAPSGGGKKDEGLFGMEGQMNSLYAGMATAAVSVPMDMAIGKSIENFAQFDQAMRLVNQELGLSEDKFKGLENQVMDLSNATGISSQELSNGLYNVVASGVTNTADAMNLLKVAAEGAKAGNTDLDTATKALNAVMGAYGMSAKDASGIMDVMFTAVNNGQMHFNDLAKSVGASATSAATAGVSYTELAAAQATLTNVGKNAESASQNLNSLIMGMIAPTSQATKEAKDLGIEWDAGALKAHGLSYMINEAMTATHGNSEELKKLLPNQRAYLAVLALGGKAHEEYTNTLNKMKNAHGATSAALEEADKGMGDQIEKLKTSTQNLGMAFVQALAPAIEKVVDGITKLVTWFNNLSGPNKEMIGIIAATVAGLASLGTIVFGVISGIGALKMGLDGLSAAFKGVAVGEEVATAATETLEATNPIGWIMLIITGVILLTAYIISHWTQIKTFLIATWDEIKKLAADLRDWFVNTWNAISQEAQKLWTDITTGIQNIWNTFIGWITGAAQKLAQAVVDAFEWLYNHNTYFKAWIDGLVAQWNWLHDTTIAVWNAIHTALQTVFGAISTAAHAVFDPIISYFTGRWNQIRTDAAAAWSLIRQAFSTLASAAKKAFTDVFDQLGSYFSNLWNEALQWGANLIHMVATGITNAAHEVEDAAKSVAQGIANFLGFHSPTKMGPASDSNTWASNFVSMFAGGLAAGAPAVASASQQLVTPLADAFNSFQNVTKEQLPQVQTALNGIIAEKNKYTAASKKGDKEAMDSAHQQADQYRAVLQQMGIDTSAFAADKTTQEVMLNKTQAMAVATKAAKDLLATQQEQAKVEKDLTSEEDKRNKILDKQNQEIAKIENNSKLSQAKKAEEIKKVEEMTQKHLDKLEAMQKTADDKAQAALDKKLKADEAAYEKSYAKVEAAAAKMQQAMQATFQKLSSGIQTEVTKIIAAIQTAEAAMTQLASMQAVSGSVGSMMGSSNTSNTSVTVQYHQNGPVFGINDLNGQIKQVMQQHAVPILHQALQQPARALGK